MSQDESMTPTKLIDINGPGALWAAIVMGVLGPAVFIVQPGFVQGLVAFYGFTEQSAGYIASAEMWGIALTTIAMIGLTQRLNWHSLLAGAILIMALGNIASVFARDPIVFASWRFAVGMGSGVLTSLAFTILGLTQHPDRNFGYLIMALLTFGAVGLGVMPSALSILGMEGLLVFFALFSLVGLPLITHLPTSAAEHRTAETPSTSLRTWHKAAAILAMLGYFAGQGAVWAYLFLIGVAGGVSEQHVANGLTLSQFLGIAGAFAAVLISNRFGRLGPITLGLLGGIVPLIVLFGDIDLWRYGAVVGVYNFAWNMTHPFLLAALASFDATGRVVTYGVAAQMLGLALGPAIAASLVEPGQFTAVYWLGIALFSATLFAIAPPILVQYRHGSTH